MSRPSKPSRRQAKQHKQKTASVAKQQNIKKIVILFTIAILIAIPFGLGKYFELNFPDPYDSPANVYSAKRILDGAQFGVEERPSAALATLIMNMLGVWLFGFSEFGPKLLQGIAQASALVIMFYTMRKLFGTLSAAVGVLIASVYLSAPLIAKFGNVKDQFMAAFMAIGISLFVLRQLGGKWWLLLLSGAFLSWAPLFKETGTSAIGAIGLFLIVQPIFGHRSWKQTAADICLLLAGAVVAVAPVYIWLLVIDAPGSYMPYRFAFRMFFPTEGATRTGAYVASSRKIISFATQWPRVLRYYGLLILPISLAAGSIILRLAKMIYFRLSKSKTDAKTTYDRFVLLFAVWWILDMAFVWISPRTYEQYFLPLNASAAMLGGYLITLYSDKLAGSVIYKTRWRIIGFVGLICMVAMSWHIFFGIGKSPHTGLRYKDPDIRRGYQQRLETISNRRKNNQKMPWEVVGDYIRRNSTPDDKIYVWGWYPAIYLQAQRICPAPKAFEGAPHTSTPLALGNRIKQVVTACAAEPPKFIVDTRKRHIPMNRPPFELWPIGKKGPLPNDENLMAQYDAMMTKMLSEDFEPAEALRYESMLPLRRFVMGNYKIVRSFGQHILFERKASQPE
ncbi:MAG: glycosyltransferase family 39 protein [Planctomycetota bacterium]|jgi:4-amino-4-deoxy-L-arabinose transferase-like glycosyltransferase